LRFLSPIHHAHRRIAVYLEAHGSGLGLRATEGHILTYLRSYSPAPVSELHRFLGIKRSTLTSVLDRLESRGWLERRASGRDRRVILVALTDGGRVHADRIREVVEQLEAEIGARIGPGDLEGFAAVVAAIDAVTAGMAAPTTHPSETAAAREDAE
jgi:DNA-binding MarR family transcriptional regulator